MTEWLWVPVTLAAALFQLVRTALQKRLKSDLDDLTITWIRYGYSLPLVWLYGWLLASQALESHSPSWQFYAMCLTGGITQIFGTVFLIGMFSHRNFAVSTAFAKTEGIQIALLGVFFISEDLSLAGWIGVLVGTAGVFALVVARSGLAVMHWKSLLGSRMALTGTLSGTCFAATSMLIKNAFEALDASDGIVGNLGHFQGSSAVLLSMVTIQAVLLGAWIAARNREAFGRMLRQKWVPAAVGITSFMGSALWFAAYALTHPAYVKTVSNIELPLAILIGSRFFGERHSWGEYAGIFLTVVGVTVVLYA